MAGPVKAYNFAQSASAAVVGPARSRIRQIVIYAAAAGHSHIVKYLLEKGVEVDQRYHHELTALMWASGMNQRSVVALLLSQGADMTLRDDRGKTASDIAIGAKAGSVVNLLE